MGLGQLLPSDGSGPSSDFLAKMLGEGTPLFCWKTALLSIFFTVALYSSNGLRFRIVNDSVGGSMLAVVKPTHFPADFSFFF